MSPTSQRQYLMEIDALKAENAKLRNALEAIAGNCPVAWQGKFMPVYQFAREVLK